MSDASNSLRTPRAFSLELPFRRFRSRLKRYSNRVASQPRPPHRPCPAPLATRHYPLATTHSPLATRHYTQCFRRDLVNTNWH